MLGGKNYIWLARWFLLGSSGDIASFPGLPTVQFLIKNGVGKPGPFYHVNDVST